MNESPSLRWVRPTPSAPLAPRASVRTQITLEALLAGRHAVGEREYVDVVDLFCGCGGFSEGARRAGHRVVLGVDSDATALAVHCANHPQAAHRQLELPHGELAALLPREGTRYHCHASPPCTKLSVGGGTNRSAPDRRTGMVLVAWFLDLVATLPCTSWSMEQVVQEDVLDELRERRRARPDRYDFEVVLMSQYGVPQDRKRVIAGTPWLISRLRDRAEPLLVRRVIDALPKPPPGSVGIKGRRTTVGREQCKSWAKAFQLPKNVIPREMRMKRGGLRRPAPTVIAGAPHRWCDAGGNTTRCLTIPEHAILQTFGSAYRLSCPYGEALRLVGNAIPPLFVEHLLAGYRVPEWVSERV